MNDRLDTEERRELPDSVYGLPERREYPMPDAAHVRAAEYGVDVESPTVRQYAAE